MPQVSAACFSRLNIGLTCLPVPNIFSEAAYPVMKNEICKFWKPKIKSWGPSSTKSCITIPSSKISFRKPELKQAELWELPGRMGDWMQAAREQARRKMGSTLSQFQTQMWCGSYVTGFWDRTDLDVITLALRMGGKEKWGVPAKTIELQAYHLSLVLKILAERLVPRSRNKTTQGVWADRSSIIH